MPCKPLATSNFSPPPSGIGGFAVPLPDLNIPFPDIPLEDLAELFDTLGLILPPGTLKPNLDADLLNNIYQAVNDLLKKFMPFLFLYRFILPILNLILCIIEIICAIANPVKLIRAVIRLFRVCLPEFLALFPFFALIIMIISLLLLLLALIEYLINRILSLIEVIIHDIIILGKAASRLDNEGIIAIVKKIGNLLCLLQNLFVIFGIIALIIQVIKAMLSLFFRIPPCDSTDGSNDGCCTTDGCPSFIKDNSTITSSTGSFQYFNAVGIDSGLVLPAGFPPIVSIIRNESWQFYDPNPTGNLAQNQQFFNIVNAFDLPAGVRKIFFPAGTNYNKTTDPSAVPYTVNFRLFYDPAIFGRSDSKGKRFIRIKDAIVQAPPTLGVSSFNNTLIAPFTGTLNLIGGTVLEDDNTTKILDDNGNPFDLNDFIHLPLNNGGVVFPSDGILFSNVVYDFNINHEVLFGANLITLGCIPEVAISRDAINTTIGAQFNANGEKLAGVAALLPDATAAQNCILENLTTYRSNISLETTNTFQTNVLACINTLKTQTNTALTAAIGAGFDQYKSTFTIDPTVQFTTLPIKVSVSLNESSGNPMTGSLPTTVAASLASQLSAVITLGEISKFTYDGNQLFVADITSKDAGTGNIKVAFNNNFISVLDNPSNIDQPVSVHIKTVDYTFVQSSAISQGADTDKPRRDVDDVAREGSDGVVE